MSCCTFSIFDIKDDALLQRQALPGECSGAFLKKPKPPTGPEERPYYAFLHGGHVEDERPRTIGDLKDEFGGKNVSCVFLAHGGHFSAAVFVGARRVAMRSYKHYVVRRGQGKRQMSHNSRKGTSKSNSAGGRIRTAQETQHAECVAKLLLDWREFLELAGDRVFIGAPGLNSRYFAHLPLQRKVGLSIGRVNQFEVARVWEELCTVRISLGDTEKEE